MIVATSTPRAHTDQRWGLAGWRGNFMRSRRQFLEYPAGPNLFHLLNLLNLFAGA